MSYVVSEDCINTAVHKIISDVNNIGHENLSDKGHVKEINRALIEIRHPTRRYLRLEGRNNNIFAMIAESIWVLAGSDKLFPTLTRFLPRAPDFSDDGQTWRGAYGPRLYKNNQLQSVMDRLTDSKSTRHGVISIYDPELDSDEAITQKLGTKKTKDLPCNNMLYFYTDASDIDRLNIHVTQRSGDAVWGMGSINIFEWTFLQEVLASVLGMEVGLYSHYVNNLHAYYDKPVVVAQIENIVDAPVVPLTDMNMTPMSMGNIKTSAQLQTFFMKLLGVLDMLCLSEHADADTALWSIEALFDGHGVPIGGKLHHYMRALVAHLRPEGGLSLAGFSPDLAEAIKVSKFRKFEII